MDNDTPWNDAAASRSAAARLYSLIFGAVGNEKPRSTVTN